MSAPRTPPPEYASPGQGHATRAFATGSVTQLRRHPWLSTVGLLTIAIIVLAMLWDWNWLKGPIERQVEAQTGREFAIDGNFDVDLGWTSASFRADAVRFGNAAWSKRPIMAAANRVEFTIRI